MFHSNQPETLEQHIIQSIHTQPDSQAMLSDIAEILGKAFQADTCLMGTKLDGEALSLIAAWTSSPTSQSRSLTSPELPFASVIKRLAKTSEPTIFKNITPNTTTNISTGLGISTRFRQAVNGVILLVKKQPYQWTQFDKDTLERVASLVALACHFAQLQSTLDDGTVNRDFSSHSLPTNIPKILENNPILKVWLSRTRNQLEQQLQLNKQLVQNIITIMSDQTRNPLATIKMGITLLRHSPPSADVLATRLDVLEKAWHKLNDVNEKILRFKTLQSNQTTLTPTLFKLKPLVQQIAQEFQKTWQEGKRQSLGLKVEFEENGLENAIKDSDWEFYTDDKNFKIIVEELLMNAGKFAIFDTTVYLKVAKQNIGKQTKLVISVSNLTQPILPKNLRYLFEPFYREQWTIDTAIAGIGLGLTIAKELAESLGGFLEVACDELESSQNCKITFKLILPQALCCATSLQ